MSAAAPHEDEAAELAGPSRVRLRFVEGVSEAAKDTETRVPAGTTLFDAASKTWRVTRDLLHRPGITNRTETQTLSAFGKWMATHTGDAFEARPVYNADGIEDSIRVASRAPTP